MKADPTHRSIFALIVILMQSGCIERYYPDEEELKTGTVVIVAHLCDNPGEQTIQLSRTSTIHYPHYEPMSACFVEVEKLNGESREFVETKPGYYSCFLDEQFLESGGQFALVVITPEGECYESEYEKLYPAAAISDLYWEREQHHTAKLEEVLDGVQFYMDFEFEKEAGMYLKWDLEETYQIHNPEYTAFVFSKDRRFMQLPDSSSWRTCWITLGIPDFYTMDLEFVEGDIFRQMPLNYVSHETRRLHIRYSLLVRQYSLSESSFRYWDELRKNMHSAGGMFDKQPALTSSNICNVNDREEVVLGFFSISGVSEKRTFVDEIKEMRLKEDPEYCYPGDYPPGLAYFPTSYLPVYLSRVFVEEAEMLGEVNKYCVDCRDYKGSAHIKPDFW